LEQSADSTNNSLSKLRKTHPTLDSLTDTTKDGILNIQGAMDSMKGLSVVMDNSITSLETEGSNIMHSINLDPQRENAEIISNKIDEVDAFLSDEKTKSSENSKFGTCINNLYFWIWDLLISQIKEIVPLFLFLSYFLLNMKFVNQK